MKNSKTTNKKWELKMKTKDKISNNKDKDKKIIL